MQYIVGGLLMLIIVIGGWLIWFYNKVTEQRILINEGWEQLQNMLKKRNDLLEESIEVEVQLFELDEKHLEKAAGVHLLLQQELQKVQEQIDVCQFIYSELVISYNKYLSTFPNNVFSMILGIRKLP